KPRPAQAPAPFGVAREHASGEGEALEIIPHPPRPVIGPIRRPEEHHVVRTKEPRDGGSFGGGLLLLHAAPALQLSLPRRAGTARGRDDRTSRRGTASCRAVRGSPCRCS